MTLGPYVPTPPPLALYDVLAAAGLGRDLFDPAQHECCERVDHYVRHVAFATLAALGALPPAAQALDATALARRAGVVPGFLARLRWLLAFLVEPGVLEETAGGYRLVAPPARVDLAALRAAALARDARYEPTYDLIDAAAALYPRVARGETSAEAALLRRPGLWVRYFSNANPYYALGNRVAARAAAARLDPGARILEIGGGLGSSAEALLDALAARGAPPASYRLTDAVPFFRRRVERALRPPPGTELVVAALDMNAPWSAQGIRPEDYDLVWAVNAVHLARDLDRVLHEAARALRPGGLLVAGEGFRRARGVPEPAEFPFQLLESFHAVRLDPAARPVPGFPYAPDLAHRLAALGWTAVEIVPPPERVRPHYAGFLGGALCARRPSPHAASTAT